MHEGEGEGEGEEEARGGGGGQRRRTAVVRALHLELERAHAHLERARPFLQLLALLLERVLALQPMLHMHTAHAMCAYAHTHYATFYGLLSISRADLLERNEYASETLRPQSDQSQFLVDQLALLIFDLIQRLHIQYNSEHTHTSQYVLVRRIRIRMYTRTSS